MTNEIKKYSFYDNFINMKPSEFKINIGFIIDYIIEEKQLNDISDKIVGFGDELDKFFEDNNINILFDQFIEDYINKYDNEKILLLINFNMEELFSLAEIFRRFKKNDKMQFCYNLCIMHKYKIGKCYYELANYYKYNNDFDEMIKNYLLSIENNYFESLYEILKYHMNNKNYDMMKKYLKIGVDKKDLKSILLMALYYRFIEKNIDEEIKYHLKILKEKFLHDYNIFADRDKYEDELYNHDIFIESLYFLSLCYKENNNEELFKYVLFQIVSFFDDCLDTFLSFDDDDSGFDWSEYKCLDVSIKYFNYKLENENYSKYIYEYSLNELINFFPKIYNNDQINYNFNYYMNSKLSTYFVLKKLKIQHFNDTNI